MNRQDYINYKMTKEAFFDFGQVTQGLGRVGRGLWEGTKAVGKGLYNAASGAANAVGNWANNTYQQGLNYANRRAQSRNPQGVMGQAGVALQHVGDQIGGMANSAVSDVAGKVKQPWRYTRAFANNLWHGQGFANSHRNAVNYSTAMNVGYNGEAAADAMNRANYNPTFSGGFNGYTANSAKPGQIYNNQYLIPQQNAQLQQFGLDRNGLPTQQQG